ncbi:hypothetical protein R3P38DRAFT_2518678, partial [Favolaschia claudopus]
NQSPLLLCVINGDKKIFNGLVRGEKGGVATAESITQQIANYLGPESLHRRGRISFWMTVYFNRCELLDRLVTNNICSVQQFDEFLAGFNKLSSRFSFVDVGYSNEADPRIIDYIHAYARFPQTARIFLAGGCSPQYTSLFKNLEADDLLQKLVAMDSDTADAPTTRLPILDLKDIIFMKQNHPSVTPANVRCAIRNDGLRNPQSAVAQIGGLVIDPTIVLSPEKPPPCNEHYLMTCSKGPAVCKYSHEYILTSDQLALLASNAKKAPCNSLRNRLNCPYGPRCCWGHVCPNGPNCVHRRKGKCWFKDGRFSYIVQLNPNSQGFNFRCHASGVIPVDSDRPPVTTI